MIDIVEATDADMPSVRMLFQEYQHRLGVDLCFQGFETELANLPGCYASPDGAILIAKTGGEKCGCVAFRPLTATEAELKRLYVNSAWRGRGIGKALFESAMTKAKAAGYRSVVLDTLPSMVTAQVMYRDYGFTETSPYYANPEAGVIYFRFVF